MGNNLSNTPEDDLNEVNNTDTPSSSTQPPPSNISQDPKVDEVSEYGINLMRNNNTTVDEISEYGINLYQRNFVDEILPVERIKFERKNMEKQIQLVNSKIEWKRNETEGNQTQAEYYKKQYKELLKVVKKIDKESVKKVESISDIQELEKLKVEFISMQ